MRWMVATAALLACVAAAPRSAEAQADSVTTCVLRGAELVAFRLAASDTAAFQDSVRRADPTPRAGYLAGKEWHREELLPYIRGWWFYRSGDPYFVEPGRLRRMAEYAGVGLYVASDASGSTDQFYLPTRPGCEFQLYHAPFGRIALDALESVNVPDPRIPPPPAVGVRVVRLCLFRGGELREESHVVDATRLDSVYARTRDPGPGYAAGERWYIDNGPIQFGRRRFVKYGLPRVMTMGELRRLGAYRGIGVYTEVAESVDDPLVLYVPVRPGCEFQVYSTEPLTGGIRG